MLAYFEKDRMLCSARVHFVFNFKVATAQRATVVSVDPVVEMMLSKLGREHALGGDGESGDKTIWLGLKNVHVAVNTMRAMRRFGEGRTCV